MPARFRIYDNGGTSADRYFLIDTRVIRTVGYEPYYDAATFSRDPSSAQGIGLTCTIARSAFIQQEMKRFRRWGRRISLLDLPNDAASFAKQFMQDCGASKASLETVAELHKKIA